MTDFWQHQDRARARSSALLALFVLSVIVTLLALNLGTAALTRWEFHDQGWRAWLWDPQCWAWTTGAALLIIAGGVFLKHRELRGGGSAIADLLGGRRVSLATDNRQEVQLLNVVEEMAIAAGLPMPEVHVLPFEFCLNAFVAGHSQRDVCLGFTAGAVDKLTREEMQALAAEQFARVFNGDMRLNMRLAVMLHGLMAVSMFGRVMMLGSLRLRGLTLAGGRLFAPLWLGTGIVFALVGFIGNLCGRFLQLAFCRQRCWLADATAVQYTRNPGSVAGLLKKSGWHNTWIRNPYAIEINHFLFGDARGEKAFRLIRTHPEILDRVRRLEPNFHGDFRQALDELKFPEPELPFSQVRAPEKRPSPSLPITGAILQIGAFTGDAIEHAQALRDRIADPLERARQDPFTAVALVYALLISGKDDTRSSQYTQLELTESQPLVAEIRRQHEAIRELGAEERLTLIELLAAPLRDLSSDQVRQLTVGIDQLSRADAQINLFEFSLKKIVLHQLEALRPNGTEDLERALTETRLIRDSELVLSALAHVGTDDEDDIAAAFQSGGNELDLEASLVLQPLNQCGLDPMNAALDRLCWLRPADKQRFVTACATTISAAGEIRPNERILFRATCAALDIPCPPLA